MFSSLKVYNDYFEPKLLIASNEMYESESRLKCHELSVNFFFNFFFDRA